MKATKPKMTLPGGFTLIQGEGREGGGRGREGGGEKANLNEVQHCLLHLLSRKTHHILSLVMMVVGMVLFLACLRELEWRHEGGTAACWSSKAPTWVNRNFTTRRGRRRML